MSPRRKAMAPKDPKAMSWFPTARFGRHPRLGLLLRAEVEPANLKPAKSRASSWSPLFLTMPARETRFPNPQRVQGNRVSCSLIISCRISLSFGIIVRFAFKNRRFILGFQLFASRAGQARADENPRILHDQAHQLGPSRQ